MIVGKKYKIFAAHEEAKLKIEILKHEKSCNLLNRKRTMKESKDGLKKNKVKKESAPE